MFRIRACVPRKATVPVAFEMPFGRSSVLNEGALQLEPSRYLGLGRRSVDGHVPYNGTRRENVWVESLEYLEIHIAVDAKGERLLAL